MDVYRPLRSVLFGYECVRLLLLTFLMTEAGVNGAFFPYVVFLSPNVLFALMALFVLVKPDEYRAYLNLYIAGKVITVLLFIVWALSVTDERPPIEDRTMFLILLGSCAMLVLADILSMLGAHLMNNKLRKACSATDEEEMKENRGGY